MIDNFKQHLRDLDDTKISFASRISSNEMQNFFNRNLTTKSSRSKIQPPDYLQQFKPQTKESQSLLQHLNDYIISDEDAAL